MFKKSKNQEEEGGGEEEEKKGNGLLRLRPTASELLFSLPLSLEKTILRSILVSCLGRAVLAQRIE